LGERTSLIPNYHSFAKTDFFGSLSKGGKSAKKVGFRAFTVINQEVTITNHGSHQEEVDR
jgi:hypothetical protein